jgi:hypothetical protein
VDLSDHVHLVVLLDQLDLQDQVLLVLLLVLADLMDLAVLGDLLVLLHPFHPLDLFAHIDPRGLEAQLVPVFPFHLQVLWGLLVLVDQVVQFALLDLFVPLALVDQQDLTLLFDQLVQNCPFLPFVQPAQLLQSFLCLLLVHLGQMDQLSPGILLFLFGLSVHQILLVLKAQ